MSKLPKEWEECYNDNIDYADPNEKYPFTAMNQGNTCCSDKHPTFYGTVISSPQWHDWYEEQMRRFHELAKGNENAEPTFDIDECNACGVIGKEHFQEFIKFLLQQNNERLAKEFEGGYLVSTPESTDRYTLGYNTAWARAIGIIKGK